MIDGNPAGNEERKSIDVFFYGLFMDADVLGRLGISANHPRRACVLDYALRIGKRATLTPSVGRKAYGMVFSLSQQDVDHLYSGPGLEDYRPEMMMAELIDGGSVHAQCYNLPGPPQAAEFNAAYAAELQSVLRNLGFPPEYVKSIH